MTIFLNFLIFAFSFLFDTARAFKFISVFGIMPQFVFVALICFCIFYGKERGLVFAVSLGLLTDIIFASPLGAHAFVYLAISVVCGITYDSLLEKNYASAALTVFVLSLGYNLTTYFFQMFLGSKAGFWFSLVRYMLPVSLYNTLISPLLYLLIGKVHDRNERIF